MAKKLKDYKNVRLNGPDGTQSPVFSTGAEAEQWYKTNYPTGYKVVEQQSEPTYQGKTLPEVTVTANAPVDYDQLQDARRQIINGNYYGQKFVPTPQNVAHYLNLMNKDRQVRKSTNPLYDPMAIAMNAIDNIARRGIEVVMRTSHGAQNPLEVMPQYLSWIVGSKGGLSRLGDIGKYVFSGTKTGPKGYYNSLVPENETGHYSYYSGFDTAGQEGNDLIDAFLYRKEIDPSYGAKRVESDYGIHNKYISEYYPDKAIPVYELTSFPTTLQAQGNVKSTGKYVGAEEFNDIKQQIPIDVNLPDIAGNIRESGIDAYGDSAYRHQDIWKFEPKAYTQKWLDSVNPVMRPIIYKAVQYVNQLGNPVVTRSPWYNRKYTTDYAKEHQNFNKNIVELKDKK